MQVHAAPAGIALSSPACCARRRLPSVWRVEAGEPAPAFALSHPAPGSERRDGLFRLASGCKKMRVRTELAGEPGFEPGLTESESAVLPLNYSPPTWPVAAEDLLQICAIACGCPREFP